MSIEIRPTVQSDFLAVCNRINDKTVKAFTVLRDGEPVCIAGVTIEQDGFAAFSDVKEGVVAPTITIWRTAKQLADRLRTLNLPAIATTDNGKFLESLGFRYVRNIKNKKIYRL